MSATLAVFLKELDPTPKIQLHEVLGSAAQESSNAWNNAGTGHAALCELNYTPQEPDGSIDISKALQVNTEFDLSRQFWAYLVNKGAIKDPQSFIHSVPHMSFVRGLENRTFLKKRFEALSAHPLYYGMEYSEDKKQIGEWIPLVMEGRDANDIVTATRMVTGTDVDYGALTEELLASLSGKEGFSVHFCSRGKIYAAMGTCGVCRFGMKKLDSSRVSNPNSFSSGQGAGRFHFCKSPGFPRGTATPGFRSAEFGFAAKRPEISSRHHAKVYGKAATGSPPMSVPHLDTRHIEGKVSLLFGPYAGFATKFLKHGSYLDSSVPSILKIYCR
jgi:malate dehydrogenase (quinone)